jgi:nitrite reductase/ring-hydroxylating ferredoxin subunit/uncharacterized membrane protein
MRVSERIIQLASSGKLDKMAEDLSRRTNETVQRSPGRQVADFCSGRWMGHPLHPALTDVPVGAWALAGIMDAVSPRRTRAATQAIFVGVLAALPTAVAGLMDWRTTRGETRRIGMTHALLNTGALTFYTLSLICRLTGTGPARLTAFSGLGLISVSAYLGGHLIEAKKVGVKREDEAGPPKDAMAPVSDQDLQEGRPVRVEIDGYGVVLVKQDRVIHALADTCPHLGCSLAGGEVRGNFIVCGCHGSTFDLDDGRALSGPTAYPVQALKASRQDGRIRVGTGLGPSISSYQTAGGE